MPKQTVTFTRVERVTLELDTIQPLSASTLEFWANRSLLGKSPIGTLEQGNKIAHTMSDWTPSKIEPKCECTPAKKKRN